MAADLFAPEFFAHGRMLYGYPRSETCRFSPMLAYNLVRHTATEGGEGRSVLWDPFCGIGLIPAIACMFFPGKFQAFVASDANPEAVACAGKNLSMVRCARAAGKRLKHIRGLQQRNAKSQRRWGEVGGYLNSLMPLIERNAGRAPLVDTYTASAFDLPRGIEGNIHFLGDLPHGKSSRMWGSDGAERLLDAVAGAYPNATMRFIMTRDMADRVLRGTETVSAVAIASKSGRAIVRAGPSGWVRSGDGPWAGPILGSTEAAL